MDQIFTSCGHKLARPAHGLDVMLFQHCSGLVQSVLKHLCGLQLSEVLGPLILPVEGQGAETNKGHTQTHERP